MHAILLSSTNKGEIVLTPEEFKQLLNIKYSLLHSEATIMQVCGTEKEKASSK